MHPTYFSARRALALITLNLLYLTGCATLPAGNRDPRDPLERMNRSVYSFNVSLDKHVLSPVAHGYAKALPQPVRNRVHNFFDNLTYSRTMLNSFLQGHPSDGVNDAARILVNTVIGLGGLFDPASHMSLERHQRDFGQTMGVWGIKKGPYLMLPFLGPSDFRDGLGLVPDVYSTPWALVSNGKIYWGMYAVKAVQDRSEIIDLERTLHEAYDPYALVRNSYLQRRDYLVKGTKANLDDDLKDPDLVDPEAPPPAKAAAPQHGNR